MDPHRVDGAAGRFRSFFDQLADTFVERDDVVHQGALALLSKEHALISGPPGTAKSALATALLGRIVCEQTGSPSLYARQITESTVQTDLIGPIDFKNLMATGRTSHFTDEGMLGAVHSFLDEVFDGRDMLLRSALNVLQERELKQGTKVTRGQIEVAMMTSNRYIADVLEHARETLLAFVDRIAFVSFVPRGFASLDNMKLVLDRHVARRQRSKLDTLLTIQDVDVLQSLTQSVVVSEAVCDALATLLADLDTEFNAAVRADPTFVPTRYLSTRTAVRSGNVLRAICCYDRVFNDPDRELQVLPKDLPWLRLHLLLAGPTPDEVEQLLSRETSPNERRQLETLRTEREIFDRCLARLPELKVPPLKKRASQPNDDSTPSAPGQSPSHPPDETSAPSRLDICEQQLSSRDANELLQTTRELSQIVERGDDDTPRAQALLQIATAALTETAVRATLDSSMSKAPLLDAIEQLVTMATDIDDSTSSMHSIASGLRRRALTMTSEVARSAIGADSSDLSTATKSQTDRKSLMARVDERITTLERLHSLRQRCQGAESPAEYTDTEWLSAVDIAEDDVARLWDAAFCSAAKKSLATHQTAALPDVLASIQGELQWLDDVAARFATIRGEPTSIKTKAIGARLTDLVAALLRRIDAIDRKTLHDEIEKALVVLEAAKLDETIAPRKWLLWAAEALIRSADSHDVGTVPFDMGGYRSLRGSIDRTPVTYTLAEVALRVTQQPKGGELGLGAVGDLLSLLPEELRDQAATLDLVRIEDVTGFVEGWWKSLCAGDMSAQERLDHVVRSRFFDVVWDESALVRFGLEARLIGEVLPGVEARATAVRARLETLEATTRKGANALLRSRTDEAWAAAVSKSE